MDSEKVIRQKVDQLPLVSRGYLVKISFKVIFTLSTFLSFEDDTYSIFNNLCYEP